MMLIPFQLVSSVEKSFFVTSKARIRLEIKLQEPTIVFPLGCFPSSRTLNQPLSSTTLLKVKKTTTGKHKNKHLDWHNLHIPRSKGSEKITLLLLVCHSTERVVPVHVLWLKSQSLNYWSGNFWRLSNDLNKQMPPTYKIDSQHIFRPQHHSSLQ